ncbi:MAG: AMP-binding protein [Acidimicrobiales bacterium]
MIFRSPYPQVDIPAVTFDELVLGDALRWGDKVALVDAPSGRSLTYRQLVETVGVVAAGLAARGMRKGDVLAILLPNLPEYAVAFFGTIRIGGVVTTINPLYTAGEVRHQLADCNARYLVTIPQLLDRAREAVAGSPVEETFVLGEASEGATSVLELMTSGSVPPEVPVDPGSDLAVLPYSSGTTGTAKGVMLTHRNLVASVVQLMAVVRPRHDDVAIALLPMYHIYGMVLIMSAGLSQGITLVSLPQFDLETFLGAIERHRVTLLHLVPPLVLAMTRHPSVDQHDLSSVRIAASGAAPLGAEMEQELSERLGCVVGQGWGMTETTSILSTNPFDQPERIRRGSAGLLIPNTEARVVDIETGDDLGPGGDGEIWVRGPQVMSGYLGGGGEAAGTVDAEGWFRTGDVGHLDDDGYVYVVDRAKELIKYKGFQVAPAELEAILLSHPSVADAAVVPSPDDEAGEVPKAFVVAAEGFDERSVLDFVASQVAPHKRVRKIELVEQIPKSPSGKVLRRDLIARERAASS